MIIIPTLLSFSSSSSSSYCYYDFCTGIIILVDIEREDRMRLGREWVSHSYPPLTTGQIALSQAMANSLKAKPDDVLYIKINGTAFFQSLWRNAQEEAAAAAKQTPQQPQDSTTTTTTNTSTSSSNVTKDYIYVPFRVAYVFKGAQGKVIYLFRDGNNNDSDNDSSINSKDNNNLTTL